jgi:predicted RNase H-like nuclease
MPGLQDGDRTRVAVEGYPGLVARAVIGRRSYKSDTRAQQTTERLIARKDMVDALEQGRWRGLRLKLTHAQRDELVADAQGDKLDAALCLLLAGWADNQPRHGMPADPDALEGWIVAADEIPGAVSADPRGPPVPGKARKKAPVTPAAKKKVDLARSR